MKEKSLRKILALALVLAMALSLSTTAFATNSYSVTPPDSNVTSITITGAEVKSCTRSQETFNPTLGSVRYTYTVVLAGTTLDNAEMNVNIQAPSGNVVSPSGCPNYPPQGVAIINGTARNDYPVTLESGVGTVTANVYKQLSVTHYGYLDEYVFNFVKETMNDTLSAAGLTMRFGDPAYPSTAPECYMAFGTTSPYSVGYTGPLTGYYPDVLAFYVTSGASSITAMNGGDAVHFVEYDSLGNITRDASTPSSAALKAGTYTLKIMQAGDLTITTSIGTATLRFSAPSSPAADTSDSKPQGIDGYLIGMSQYANNGSWGSISDATNSLSDTTKLKGVSGSNTSGYSLGSLGGYVQYDFSSNPIRNLSTNPYGVDFIIYGNAFNGNPEAAAVQVYGQTSDGQFGWYELAGSRYYAADTVRNQTVVYTLDSSGVNAGVGANQSAAEAALTQFRAATGWFPAYDSMSHAATSGVSNPLTNDHISFYSSNKIVFNHVTSIADSDLNIDYAFGYADVTPNPSSSDGAYGVAVNPYTPFSSTKKGGDGFDLSWAVDIVTGEPVSVDNVTKIRIYSAVLHDTGIFGETSPEILYVYKASQGETPAEVGTTADPTVKSGRTTLILTNGGLYQNAPKTFTVTSSAANIYVNGELTESGTAFDFSNITATKLVQIIVQDGTKAPFITWLKINP